MGLGSSCGNKWKGVKIKLLLVAATVLAGVVALAQLRITSFKPSGEITWTNFARVGAYRVVWADSPTGQWKPFDPQTNLNSIWVSTNRVTVQVPLSNSPAFFRVLWTPPDATGEWSYRGYDSQGTLGLTGKLSISPRTLLSSNPPLYSFSGWRDIKYAGPPTNESVYPFAYQIGTGGFSGRLDVGYAQLDLSWPTNCLDCESGLGGTLWPNTYTGVWYYSTWGGPARGGTFAP